MRIDINGREVKIGDKVRGFGNIVFQDGFKINRESLVTVRLNEKGHMYFGELSHESFPSFEIIGKIE